MTRRWLAIPAAVALGLIAETGWPSGTETRLILADLTIGWLFFGGGLAVWISRPANRMGLLMMATGATWFVATFYPPAAFLYCGPLAHTLGAHPTGRLAGRTMRACVAAVYIASLASVLVSLVAAGLMIGALILAIGTSRLLGSGHLLGRSNRATDIATVLVGLILVVVSAARLIGSPIDDAGLLVYQVALAAIVVSMVADILWRASSPGVLTRIVVDLGGSAEAGTLRDRLARAVGDPSLVLGYRVDGGAAEWVDDTGAPVARPKVTPDRSVAPIAVGGRDLGFVAYDSALVGDPRVLGLVAAAAGLAISNSATQAEIRNRVAEVAASRERLVHAADAQGRRIESALEGGVEVRLGRITELLSVAATRRPDDTHLRAVLEDLDIARQRLREFARGVYPAALRSGGLKAAIEDVAGRSPVHVDVTARAVGRYDPAVESTLYFVCSEAVANVAKHAGAKLVRIELLEADRRVLVLRIADDGVGGAVMGAGSGLRGLADRVEALGGSLAIDSQPGRGTVVTVSVPRRLPTRQPATLAA